MSAREAVPVATALRVPILTDADIVTARGQGRLIGRDLGFGASDLVLIATAISELARNILRYARQGEIRLRPLRTGTQVGMEVVAADSGPGIPDVAKAMEDGYSSEGGLGLGLPGVRRLADEFNLSSAPGEGTVVRMTKWRWR